MLHADDRWAINDTVSLHGHIFDGGHLNRLEEIFTSDVIYDMNAVGIGAFEGIDMVRGAAAQMEDRGVGPLAHHVTNIVVTGEEGDIVTVESKGLMVMRDGAVESVTHLDTVCRHDGGWRISRRIISPLRPVAHAPAGALTDER
jgi:hypothetical protein